MINSVSSAKISFQGGALTKAQRCVKTGIREAVPVTIAGATGGMTAMATNNPVMGFLVGAFSAVSLKVVKDSIEHSLYIKSLLKGKTPYMSKFNIFKKEIMAAQSGKGSILTNPYKIIAIRANVAKLRNVVAERQGIVKTTEPKGIKKLLQDWV